MMSKRTKGSLIYIFIIAFTLFMYQESNAQNARANAKELQSAKNNQQKSEINFTISMTKPWTHLLEVEMRIKDSAMPEKSEISMPVWTPGSYLIREYARHVQNFAAMDAGGKNLAWRKIDKNSWQIDSKGVSELVVKYNVYANELTVRTNELNSEHAFFNNSALLMYPKGGLNLPSIVKVNPYGNWKVATGLPKVSGQANTFRAENFDILYDSPFEVSDFKEITFTVDGKPHRYVVTGEGNYDLAQIARDSAKIAEEGIKIFGDLPVSDYLYILNTRGGGGLEHLNSTALQFGKFNFKSRYVDFMTLVAHEYFHLWNVKRIKPDVLGPFDYDNENYTPLLWVAEGGTAYYEGVLVRRAGLINDKEFLAGKAAAIQALQERPGRFETSLEESSFDAWIKYYRPDENSINNQISYYDKGEIVNFLLDIEIRRLSNGAKSMDDVMRYLYDEFAKKNKNFSSGDFQKICEMMAGKSLEDFFSKYVRGRADIDYNGILNSVGLRLETGNGRETAYLGANLRQEGDRLTIASLPAGTPAYDFGLNSNDQIIAVDGYRASQNFLQSYLSEKKAGDKIKLTVFRFDEIMEFEVTLASKRAGNFRIAAVSNPSESQKRLYRGLMGAELK